MAYMSTTTPFRDAAFAKRRGKAVDPVMHMPPPDLLSSEKKDATLPKIQEKGEAGPTETTSAQTSSDSGIEPKSVTPEGSTKHVPQPSAENGDRKTLENGPMETVLQAGSESKGPVNKKKKPAMSPPPYIHSFDTYVMVQGLEEGKFTEDQAINAMKAIRALLAVNLNKARDVLVSKGDVENVSLAS